MSKRVPLEGEVTAEAKTSSHPVQSSSSDALDNKEEEDRDNPEVSRSKRKYCDITACLSLQSLIPPQGRLSQAQAKVQASKSKGGGRRPDNEEDVNWDAVIARCNSHPHEARESYFKRRNTPKRQCNTASQESNSVSDSPINYKPLHAACKCDPPLEAVEAILHAHPSAALDNTFEGTALKIAAENRVSSLEVLRLLMVAELAMYKKLLEDKYRQQSTQESNHAASGASQELSSASSVFYGKNPITWICEPSIPVKTLEMLLRWLPWGAFKRPSVIDGAPDNMILESPLIEIIDAFARDQDDIDDDDESSDTEPEEKDYESDKPPEKVSPGKLRTTVRSISSEKKRLRRWKKFLHILFATDRVLHPAAQTMLAQASMRNDDHTQHLQTQSEQSRPFRPVHALMRCITNQYLGLELCRPYGVWFILQEMTRLIPQEFVAHDESDGRTPFQILAESQASDCRLCHAEIKDIVECLMDADHRTAFSPRLSDGRLLGHVAVENGWPCKDLLATKTTASCA